MTKNNNFKMKPWTTQHKKLYSMLHNYVKTQIKEADKDNFKDDIKTIEAH